MEGLIALAILNIPVYFLIGWVVFDGWGDFFESIIFWLKPDFWSFLSGELMEDWWAEMKILFFLLLCGLVLFGEYQTFGNAVGNLVKGLM
ncbi:hypothetical protein KQI84_04740 [bacterium]|nr:hypothetical protein [bacterium]